MQQLTQRPRYAKHNLERAYGLTTHLFDEQRTGLTDRQRQEASLLLELLTPVVKPLADPEVPRSAQLRLLRRFDDTVQVMPAPWF